MKKFIIILFILFAFPVFAAEEAKKDENFFAVVPVPVYTPETEWALFIVGAYIFKLDHADKITPPSLAQINLAYTQLNQSDAFFEFDHYWKNSEYTLKAVIEYKKYPDRFLDIGNDYMAGSAGYKYTLEFEYIWLEFYKKIHESFHLGAKWFGQRSVLLASEFSGAVPGDAAGFDSGLGMLAKWDTRDSVYFPMDGDYLQAAVMFFGEAIGSSHDFVKWDLDLRHYFKIAPEHSVSLQGLLLAEAGSPPFYFMNMLGGDKLLRGYYKGTGRDRCLTALQAEYKWIFTERFAATAHAAAGTVADEITEFSTGKVLWSAGVGLRFFFDETSRMTFRADLGFGDGDMGLYLVAGEAF